MLRTKDKKILMTEGDFGLSLPITITGGEISNEEEIKFSIKKINGEEIIQPKIYKNINNNTFNLAFDKTESDLLKKGTYLYYLDWYKSDEFLGNVINGEIFEVEGK